MYHFNNPNATELGTTAAGGDYYYSYGDGLFIVLNTNNYNVAEHQQAMGEDSCSCTSGCCMEDRYDASGYLRNRTGSLRHRRHDPSYPADTDF